MMDSPETIRASHGRKARWLASLTALAVFGWLGLEWLFQVTKPSHLAAADWGERWQALVVGPLPVVVMATAATFLLGLVGRVLPVGDSLATGLAVAVPASVCAATAFLLLDNFTYTVFGFGVGNSAGAARAGYAGLALLLLAIFWRKLSSWTVGAAHRRAVPVAAGGLIVVSVISAAWSFNPVARPSRGSEVGRGELPNVIVLGADGLEASAMSLYGAPRATTPFLEELAGEALVVENSYTNANKTAAALAALLSGKYPATTKIVDALDRFKGVHSRQHLPGLLRQLGYFTEQISVRLFADSYDLGMRGGFQVANGRRVEARGGRLGRWFAASFPMASAFLELSLERVTERLRHAFGLSNMVNPYDLVVKASVASTSDEELMTRVEEAIVTSEEPFFLHVHFLGTHGPLFDPKTPVFSAGMDQSAEWMDPFYDDAILEFDTRVRRVVQLLEESGRLEHTVVIVLSDHAKDWSIDSRLPLIFRFPAGEHRGRIAANGQLLDVAPTLLEYLGQPVPDWMEGRSLLSERLDDPVVSLDSAAIGRSDAGIPEWSPYRLEKVALFYCDERYELWVRTEEIESHRVAGHTAPCDGELLEDEAIRRAAWRHLEERGYRRDVAE